MATGFSVSVNIGGKVLPSLAGAVSGAKSQIRTLEAVATGLAAKINAPFAAIIAATQKHLEKVQRAGRNLTFGVTMPAVYGFAGMVKAAKERAEAGNTIEAIGDLPHDKRKDVEAFADSIAAKFGDATGILRTFNELLKAGFDATAAKGSLPAILSGSTLAEDMTGAELGSYVSKIVTQYKLGMSSVEAATESSRRVVDNLVFAAVKSVASTKDVAEAFKFVGSAAAAAGGSVESTNAMILALAREGQLASEAGVAMRSAFVRMVKPTKGGLATIARLGLNYGDYVGGGKRSGAGVIAGLGSAGIDMTGREKDIDQALAQNKGSPEKQRKAIYDAVVAKVGAESATDRETVMRAVDDAYALSGSKVDMVKFLTDLRAKGANQGDLATIFEGRQSVRMLALLKSDLNELLSQIVREAPGYAESRFEIKNQGLPKTLRQLDAAWKSLRNTLFDVMAPSITTGFERLADTFKSLAATSPALLKTGVALTAAAAAAGPLMFALGAVGRVALAPFRLLAGAVKLLLWPLRAVTSAAVLMRGALMLTVPGTIVTGLAVAGTFIYNNWKNLPAFFDSFKQSLMRNLAPGAEGNGQWLIDKAKEAYSWFSDLTKSLSADTWRGWGDAAGSAVAGLVNSFSHIVDQVSQVVNQVIERWRSGGWEGLGRMIGSAILKGIVSGLGNLASLFSNFKLPTFGSVVGGMMNGPSGAPAAAPTPSVPISGARALGGPVSFGKPYLVGERGPELFVPGMSGRIETNDRLRRVLADGVAMTTESPNNTMNRGPVTFSPTFHITGGNPQAIADQIDNRMRRFLAELEAEQRGFLSD